MTRTILASASALAFVGALALAPAAALAADAANPYGNINHANDAGNNTGDSQVDQLNAAQLDQNYWPSHQATAMARPSYPPTYYPQGYRPAPPAYPPAYAPPPYPAPMGVPPGQ